MKKIKFRQWFPCVLFAVYLIAVIWLTLLGKKRSAGISKAELTPFWEYVNAFKNHQRKFYIKQIAGNIALFVPFGFLLPFQPQPRGKMFPRVLVCGICFSAVIEITQYVTGRGCMEFDDLFNNTVGALIGYGIYKLAVNDCHHSY